MTSIAVLARSAAFALLLGSDLHAVPSAPAVREHGPARWVRVRVWGSGAVAPSVSVRVPAALVSIAVDLLSLGGALDLPLHAEADGVCGVSSSVTLHTRAIVRSWAALVRSGAADLVEVTDEDGTRVSVRLE